MFSFESKKDIKNLIPMLNSFNIDKKDSSQVNEIFSAIVYLYSLGKLDKLIYPFTIIKRESPDFSILCYDIHDSCGIEHTLATLQDYKMAESELNKMQLGSKLETNYYYPGNKLQQKDINIGLRLPKEPLVGQCYYGDRPEKEWAEIIKNAILKKTRSLNDGHLETFSINELLIEDDSPVEVMIDVGKALEYLTHHIDKYLSSGFAKLFDRIHIITKNTFIYNVLHDNRIVNFSRNAINHNR